MFPMAILHATALAALMTGPTVRPPMAVGRAVRASVVASELFSGLDIDQDAVNTAMQSVADREEKAEAEERRNEARAAWAEVEAAVPAMETSAAPVLTLYRDTNGWCPFCERVWLQLSIKGIPFREELIDLRDKPDWYTEMVPTKLVPAIKYDSDGLVAWESEVLMRQIEERFPDTPPMLPEEGTAANATADHMMKRCGEVLMAGVRVSYPNASATDAERAAQQVKFEEELTALDAEVAANGGPYLAGEAVSVVDAMYMPMMERWAVQLPLTTGIHLRPDGDASAKYPALARWLDTMETEVPAYRDVVKGDAYSWSALVGTFQRMFSGNTTDPAKLAAAAATIDKADRAANAELRSLASMELHAHSAENRMAAARALVNNRVNVLADAVNEAPKSQTQLRRLEGEDAEAVDAGLREVCRRLLDLPAESLVPEYATSPEQAAAVARGSKYVASRICVPRDMGAPAAALLRATLLEIAEQEERFAWSASGGML